MKCSCTFYSFVVYETLLQIIYFQIIKYVVSKVFYHKINLAYWQTIIPLDNVPHLSRFRHKTELNMKLYRFFTKPKKNNTFIIISVKPSPDIKLNNSHFNYENINISNIQKIQWSYQNVKDSEFYILQQAKSLHYNVILLFQFNSSNQNQAKLLKLLILLA